MLESNNGVAVVAEGTTVMGTSELVETTHKKVKSTEKTPKSSKKDSKDGKKGKKGKKVRKSITQAIFAIFDKKGVEKVTYEESYKVAKSIKPTTKFNKYHYAWYKNAYNNRD